MVLWRIRTDLTWLAIWVFVRHSAVRGPLSPFASLCSIGDIWDAGRSLLQVLQDASAQHWDLLGRHPNRPGPCILGGERNELVVFSFPLVRGSVLGSHWGFQNSPRGDLVRCRWANFRVREHIKVEDTEAGWSCFWRRVKQLVEFSPEPDLFDRVQLRTRCNYKSHKRFIGLSHAGIVTCSPHFLVSK